MSKETKIQTVAAAIAALLGILRMFGITAVEDVTQDTIIAWATVIVVIGTWAYASHYKNNDFTKEACEHTGLMRLAKKRNKNFIGENFFDDPEINEEEK